MAALRTRMAGVVLRNGRPIPDAPLRDPEPVRTAESAEIERPAAQTLIATPDPPTPHFQAHDTDKLKDYRDQDVPYFLND
jgi:hypothetical protein